MERWRAVIPTPVISTSFRHPPDTFPLYRHSYRDADGLHENVYDDLDTALGQWLINFAVQENFYIWISPQWQLWERCDATQLAMSFNPAQYQYKKDVQKYHRHIAQLAKCTYCPCTWHSDSPLLVAEKQENDFEELIHEAYHCFNDQDMCWDCDSALIVLIRELIHKSIKAGDLPVLIDERNPPTLQDLSIKAIRASLGKPAKTLKTFTLPLPHTLIKRVDGGIVGHPKYKYCPII